MEDNFDLPSNKKVLKSEKRKENRLEEIGHRRTGRVVRGVSVPGVGLKVVSGQKKKDV